MVMRMLRAGIAAGLVWMLAGCGSGGMQIVPSDSVALEPGAGNAMVVFLLPSNVEGRVRASVFDITGEEREIIGIMYQKTRIAYPVPAGERRFMVIGENADFLDADLLAGKTYYVKIDPKLGRVKPRYEFVPFSKADYADPRKAPACGGCSWLQNTEKSKSWARVNARSIGIRQDRYQETWLQSGDRAKLRQGDHR